MKIFFIIFLLSFLFNGNVFAKSKYFQEGVELFNKDKFESAKIKFEQDIVFNPKSELSYLYLSKIFNKLEDKNLEEIINLFKKKDGSKSALVLLS